MSREKKDPQEYPSLHTLDARVTSLMVQRPELRDMPLGLPGMMVADHYLSA